MIGVGIVGLSARGGWAAGAHLPALRSLDGYELRGVSASSAESAAAAGEKYGVPLRFAGAAELAAHESIDLVVVAVKVPQHQELVQAALAAGKMVYCEWPLGRNLAEAEYMAALAAARGVRTAIGLQARSAPVFRYLNDLIRDGYIGEVLSTSVVASGVNWGASFRAGAEYMLDGVNGATMLTVPVAHTLDLLTFVLGDFSHLTATLASRRTEARNRETGEVKPMSVADQVVIGGTLTGGAVASVHFRGGISRGTKFLWEINGTDGDLVITLDSPPIVQLTGATIRGGRGDDTTLTELRLPPEYERVPALAGRHDEMAYNLAHAYEQLYRDVRDNDGDGGGDGAGAPLTPDFADAVRLHRLLDDIGRSAPGHGLLP
jgi:predicted dehydrogenase